MATLIMQCLYILLISCISTQLKVMVSLFEFVESVALMWNKSGLIHTPIFLYRFLVLCYFGGIEIVQLYDCLIS
jgi:hypothetical protein